MFSVKAIFFKYLIAPSAIDIFGFVINNSGSNCEINPSPLHSGHAPSGELNEKKAGSSLPIVKSQYGQA